MFNLLVKGSPWGDGHDRIDRSRVFEYTDSDVLHGVMPGLDIDFDTVIRFPALMMQETAGEFERVARIAQIHRVHVDESTRKLLLDYSLDSSFPPMLNGNLERFASELRIQPFEFAREHWAVKDADLFRALLRNAPVRRRRSSVLRLSEFESVAPNLTSAMMPFNSTFNTVYRTIQAAAAEAGFECNRADDIWQNPAIIDDVISLIDRSTVVICDCTDRNPNVFYELGIAHALGREVIIITQSSGDIPFDLRHLRYVHYANTPAGRRSLKTSLIAKLRDIAASRQI